MKLTSQQVYNFKNKKPSNITKIGADRRPLNNQNFTSNIPTKLADTIQDSAEIIFRKTVDGEIICNNAQKLSNNLNKLFGDNIFSKRLAEAGGVLNEANEIVIKNRSFLKDDVLKTILFPLDIVASLAEKYSTRFNKQFSDDSFLKKLIDNKKQAEARDWVLDTLEEFSQRKYDEVLKFDKQKASFEDIITSNITKTQKGYATRDERTLNRIVTSCVSAIYAGWDFFNISMLEKDNKEDAREAQKDRLKQETNRMALNAGLTFAALGILDRYTKRNIILNSLVIAGSALAAEIISRLKSGTPLKVLTPQEAAKVAQLRKERKEQIKNKNQKVTFRANIKPEHQIFNNFTSKDGSINALNVQNRTIASESSANKATQPKKKAKALKMVAGAFGIATLAFFASKALKGDFRAIKNHKEFVEKFGDENATKNYFKKNVVITFENLWTSAKNLIRRLNKEAPIKKKAYYSKKIDIEALKESGKFEEAKKTAEQIARKHKDSTDSASFWSNLQKILTTTKTSETTENIIGELETLKNNPKSKEIEGLLEAYINHAKDYAKENKIVDSRDEIFILSGVVKGFSKIFKTIYDILTIPAKGLNALFESITGADVNRNAFKCANKKLNPSSEGYKKELMQIHKLIKKNEGKDINELIDSIKTLSRNVETSQETGDLANISRTMVTAISTYFFVNDYRNRVLIESEGKNIQGAKEEMTERIWHKVFNFIINGTLMNVFNTTFAKIVNGSLIGAAGIAAATETTNEFLIRKSLCQPVLPQDSKQDIIDFEIEQTSKSGPWGAWSRFFKKITGKKTLTQKAGIDTKKFAEPQKIAGTKVQTHQG